MKISITGVITDTTVTQVRNALAQADGAPIDVYIYSPGGNVQAGFAIFNALKSYSGISEAHIDSMGSMATVVAAGCTRRTMAANGYALYHLPRTSAGGTEQELRDTADTLKTMTAAMIDAYTGSGATIPLETFRGMLEKETLLTAAQCLKFGLIDKVEAASQAAAMASDWETFACCTNENTKQDEPEMPKWLIDKLAAMGVKVETDAQGNVSNQAAVEGALAAVAQNHETAIAAAQAQAKAEALAEFEGKATADSKKASLVAKLRAENKLANNDEAKAFIEASSFEALEAFGSVAVALAPIGQVDHKAVSKPADVAPDAAELDNIDQLMSMDEEQD